VAQEQATWTVMAALDWTRGYLERAGDEHARRSAEWLLEASTGLARFDLYTHFDQPLTPEERACLRESVARRAQGEPLQYITGTAPFRHLEIKVTPAVLIPRPETEVLVDLALEELEASTGRGQGIDLRLRVPGRAIARQTRSADPDALPSSPRILDLCTGSGCIALSLIQEAGVDVTATDLSPEALAVARENAEALGLSDQLDLREGDLFGALGPDERFDLILSNPPYVPLADKDALPREVTGFEPPLALFSGGDGLDVFRRIIADASRHLTGKGVIIMELHEDNAMRAMQEAVKLDRYEAIDVLPDLTGRSRFVRLSGKTSG